MKQFKTHYNPMDIHSQIECYIYVKYVKETKCRSVKHYLLGWKFKKKSVMVSL